ncbi:MAG: hypothetical protein ACXWVZ_04915, partial [Kaistella sp.]
PRPASTSPGAPQPVPASSVLSLQRTPPSRDRKRMPGRDGRGGEWFGLLINHGEPSWEPIGGPLRCFFVAVGGRMPTGIFARSVGVLVGKNGESMQKIFLWFMFFLGAIPPVLIINPFMGRQAKIGFGYLMAIFGYMFIYLFSMFMIFIFLNMELSTTEGAGKRFLTGWGVGFLLTLWCTNIEVWDYVRPATRSAMRALVAVSKFVVMVTRKYIFPAFRWFGIKIYELVTKKKYIEKTKQDQEREEKPQSMEAPKTAREKSVEDILNKLDKF